MKHVGIMRDERSSVRGENEIPKADEYRLHFYPYKDLVINSHLHPRYVVYQAGFRLAKMEGGDVLDMLDEHGKVVRKLIKIYQVWTRDLPRNAYAEASYGPPQFLPRGNAGQGSFQGTVPERIVSMRRRKHEAAQQLKSPTKIKNKVAEVKEGEEEEEEQGEEEVEEEDIFRN